MVHESGAGTSHRVSLLQMPRITPSHMEVHSLEEMFMFCDVLYVEFVLQ